MSWIDFNASAMNLPSDFILESGTIRLRRFSFEDREHIWSASRFPGFTDGMTWEPPDKIEDIDDFYSYLTAAWEKGANYTFTIENRSIGEFLGRISLRLEGKSRWSLGFWTHPAHQRKGIMSQAVKLMVALAFDQLGALRVESGHADWNVSSCRVLLNSAMEVEGHTEQGYLKNGKWVPAEIHALYREKWLKIKAGY